MTLRTEVHEIMAEPLRRFVAAEQEARRALEADASVEIEIDQNTVTQFMFDSMLAIGQALVAIADRIDHLEEDDSAAGG